MRAVLPTSEGYVERDGSAIHYEVYGEDGPTILLLPTWEFVHSRHWKMQIPVFSRHYRVVTYDATGTGRSSRPLRADRYSHLNRVRDAIAVLDATETPTALAVGYSMGGELAIYLAALHADRLDGAVSLAGGHPWRVPMPGREAPQWDPEGDSPPEGWARFDFGYWRRDWRDFIEFFMAGVNSDPHSTKGWDDAVGWGLEQEPDVLAWSITDAEDFDIDDMRTRLSQTTVPTLLIHGTADEIAHPENSVITRDLMPNARLINYAGAGHPAMARYPVRFNDDVLAFAREILGASIVDREADAVAAAALAGSPARGKRVLYISSPIGLGHARRDVAIADELLELHPDARIDWLAQDPVTRVLAAAGHRIHPASAALASESAHIEDECGEHALDAFEAIRRMDEILCHNFHVFDDVAAQGNYDLVIADESWELDYHLFENPSHKRAPLAWMTDFVGFLPMPKGGARQAAVAADYNLEMIEHVARHPDMRDAAVFVGAPDDVVGGTFGPGLPEIRDWTEANFDFSGYVTGFDPRSLGEREELRAQVGFRPDERVCIVSVGGSGVGMDLLRRVVAAFPAAKRAIPDLRMIVVTGPRIDPATMPQIPGVEYHAYVDKLYRWLTACDLAIVQGGLTTTMELTAAKVPFIYVPLRDHFEQNFHVRARLERYRAGRLMDYDELSPDSLAGAMVEELDRDHNVVDVETDGAARAAAIIGRLL